MPTNRISHQGIVDSIKHNCVSVRIVQSAACASCSAAKLCRSSEQKEKIIDVVTTHPENYTIGQEVTIVGSVSQGLKATLWAYVLPLVLMLVVMVTANIVGASDALVALSGLAVLAIYYLGMYLMRGRMEKTLAFSIE